MRVCTKCHTAKPAEDYYKEKRTLDGLKAWCKKCHNKCVAASNKKRYVPRPRVKLSPEQLKINKKKYIQNLSPEKLAELRKKQKEYREANKEKNIEYKRLYQIKNKERLNKISSEYHRNKKAERREYLDKYLPRRRKLRAERSETDPLYRICVNLRNRVSTAFRLRQGWGKKGYSREILGCDYETAAKFIEDRFHPDMDWGNYGATVDCWCVDHKIPLASAKTEDELRALCHYTNLQPMWVLENLKKSNRFPGEWEHL